MFDKFLNLFERLVIALEVLAGGSGQTAAICEKVVTPQGSAPASALGEYPAEEDREAWLIMAKDRGIPVPPRTKTNTIIEKVKSLDAAKSAGPGIGAPAATFQPGVVEEDPLAADEADPLGGDEVATEEPVTREKALEALQAFRGTFSDPKAGNRAIIKVLTDAGVPKKGDNPCPGFGDATDAHFAAIYKAATRK